MIADVNSNQWLRIDDHDHESYLHILLEVFILNFLTTPNVHSPQDHYCFTNQVNNFSVPMQEFCKPKPNFIKLSNVKMEHNRWIIFIF